MMSMPWTGLIMSQFKALVLPMNPQLQEDLNQAIENEAWRLNLMHIAIGIRSIMKAKGMTQLQLAEKMNLSKSEISKLLSGKENLSVKTISKLEKVLGEPVIEILKPTPLNYELTPA